MSNADVLKQQIERELAQYKIVVYSKGTADAPRCGFTLETVNFLKQFNVPFTFIDVLEDIEKRQVLSDMTDWPTLPKIFINGKFYGDTDVLGPMADSGELQKILAELTQPVA